MKKTDLASRLNWEIGNQKLESRTLNLEFQISARRRAAAEGSAFGSMSRTQLLPTPPRRAGVVCSYRVGQASPILCYPFANMVGECCAIPREPVGLPYNSMGDMDKLCLGDNLKILRERVPDGSAAPICLAPPSNANANYNVLIMEKSGEGPAQQITGLEDARVCPLGPGAGHREVGETSLRVTLMAGALFGFPPGHERATAHVLR
jgi:hypothetical protein